MELSVGKEELKSLLKEALKELQEETKPIKLHEDCPFSQDDVVIFKRFKNFVDSLATWIGRAIILAIVSGIIWIVNLGLEAWRAMGKGP